MKMQNIPSILTIIIVVAAAAVGAATLARPKLVGSQSDLDHFSAVRAMDHVRAIAQKPHPPGSAEIERVREYITKELESLELSYHIQKDAVAVQQGSSIIATSVMNIIARIPGIESKNTILLGSHYDTRAMTPGASDNSSAVAVVLETARAILENGGVRNDIILLFTDNEEYGGGLGAEAFLRSHPWADEIDCVLNFEGLGSTGPSILFETGPDSGGLVRCWARSAQLPVGQSWFHEIYSKTPINTDLTRFSESGVPGLNFAHWARSTIYHTPLDTVESLDVKSLQHTGSYALAMAKTLDAQYFSTHRGTGDAVYFNVFPGVMVWYPASWAVPLSIVAGLVIFSVGFLGVRRSRVSLRGTVGGLLWSLLGLILSAGLATGIWMAVSGLHELYRGMFTFRGMVYNAAFYLVSFGAMAAGFAAVFVIRSRKTANTRDFSLGVAALLWILSIATSVAFPGFSYLFTWPSFFLALAVGWTVLRPASHGDAVRLTLGAIPGVILAVPAISVMSHFAPSMMIGGVVFLMAALAFMISPVWDALTTRRRWVLPVVCAGVFAVGLIAGNITATPSPERPRPNAVTYLQDDDNHTGTWYSAGTVRDEWTSLFTGDSPRQTSVGELLPVKSPAEWFPVLASKAEYAIVPGPTVNILDDTTEGEVRSVSLLVQSTRNAQVITVEIEPQGAVLSSSVVGSRFEAAPDGGGLWRLVYYAPSPNGIEIALELDTSEPATLQITDRTWEIDPRALQTVTAGERGDRMMAMPNFDYGTLVVATHKLQ